MESWGKGVKQQVWNLVGRVVRRGGVPLLLCVTLLSGTLGQLATAGFGGQQVAYAAGAPGRNTFHPSNDHGKQGVYLPGQLHTVTTPPPRDKSFRPKPVSMQPGDLALDPATAAHFLGSDKRLAGRGVEPLRWLDQLGRAQCDEHVYLLYLLLSGLHLRDLGG